MHVIQRGNNREPTFFRDDDYRQYKEWLTEAAAEYGSSVHAHVLMTNHVHLLVTPEDAECAAAHYAVLGPALRAVREPDVPADRNLWESRYRACPVDSDEYFFSCCRYIELNPVRAGMVGHPRDYRWSSYRAHAEGKQDALAIEPAIFRRLGTSAAARQIGYRNLFQQPLEKGFVDELRAATNGGWLLATISSGARSQKRSTGVWRHSPQAGLPRWQLTKHK